MFLSEKRITKMLIRLHGCAGWSASLLFTYGISKFCHGWAHSSSKPRWKRINFAIKLKFLFVRAHRSLTVSRAEFNLISRILKYRLKLRWGFHPIGKNFLILMWMWQYELIMLIVGISVETRTKLLSQRPVWLCSENIYQVNGGCFQPSENIKMVSWDDN